MFSIYAIGTLIQGIGSEKILSGHSLKIERQFWIRKLDQTYLVRLVRPFDSVPDVLVLVFFVVLPRFIFRLSYLFLYKRVDFNPGTLALNKVHPKFFINIFFSR